MIPYIKYTMINADYIFIRPDEEFGKRFNFCTELDDIGTGKFDVSLANGSKVEVVSDPVEIYREKYGGNISVTKIKADIAIDYHTIIKEFWIPTQYLSGLQ